MGVFLEQVEIQNGVEKLIKKEKKKKDNENDRLVFLKIIS
jgi:hypothetical protein